MLMKAPVLHSPREPLAVEDVEIDDPRAGEVRVKMTASGVCHSCLYAWDGSAQNVRTPMVLGDEGAGVVEAVGPGVESVGPGDRVIISWAPNCGRCHFCVIGRPVLCDVRGRQPSRLRLPPSGLGTDGREVANFGGVATYGSYTVIPESGAVRIPDAMPLDTAALIGCSVMTGVGSVLNTARVEAGESLAVFGCGGVGLNAVQGGRIAGAYPLIAVDVADNKLEYAQAMGATHTINAAREDAVEAIQQLTSRGADYAVVAVGDTRVQAQAYRAISRGGTLVVVGMAQSGELTIDSKAPLVMQERCIKGSCYGSARPREDFLRLVNLYLTGRLKIDELITRRYTIGQATEAFEDLEQGRLARGLIVFD
ncbi:MAG TPA: Zn-dependent alcohol dehydrogenase [Chloroflexota bacterium]|jgi:S-(hydroxymethyl)glutathione dehydrogenase/alcohol dehydrogenase|nr:Zn-dependent alcohol dehydrogenase [Chloroflexota bacterium]